MKKEKFLVCIIFAIISISTTVFGVNFSDLSKQHWAYEDIIKMTNEGILNGYPDGTFKPEKFITRAEFSKIFTISLNLENESQDTRFEDVSTQHWAYNYIQITSNYLLGYRNENKLVSFFPDQNAKREDVAVAMVKALGLDGEECDSDTLEKFSDVEKITKTNCKYVAIAVEKNLMSGHANGNFEPDGYLTRAQVSKIISNINNMKDNEIVNDSDNENTDFYDDIETEDNIKLEDNIENEDIVPDDNSKMEDINKAEEDVGIENGSKKEEIKDDQNFGNNEKYIVKIDEKNALPAYSKEELKIVLNKWLLSRYNEKDIEWLYTNVFTDKSLDLIIRGQKEYKVSAIFSIAVATLEQQLGLSNTVLAKEPVYNIFSIKGSLNGGVKYLNNTWNKYYSYGDAFYNFSKLIGETGPYFRDGKYGINGIGKIYSNEEWVSKVENIVTEIMKYNPKDENSEQVEKIVENFGSNVELINAIKNCKAYYKAHGFQYCICGNGGRMIPPYTGNTEEVTGFSNLSVRQSKVACTRCGGSEGYRTDSSTYCSWVIYEYAKENDWTELQEMFSVQNASSVFINHANKLKNGEVTGAYKYMTLVWHRGRGDSEIIAKQLLQEGDILIYGEDTTNHVEFSAGKWGSVYSCGSNSGIGAGANTTTGRSISGLTAIIRIK